jgi:hypothetical protein
MSLLQREALGGRGVGSWRCRSARLAQLGVTRLFVIVRRGASGGSPLLGAPVRPGRAGAWRSSARARRALPGGHPASRDTFMTLCRVRHNVINAGLVVMPGPTFRALRTVAEVDEMGWCSAHAYLALVRTSRWIRRCGHSERSSDGVGEPG